MDVGIGLPNTVGGVEPRAIVEWARRAEDAGFPSLGSLDRLVYPGHEALISLAAAAAVTERIRLATDILIAPVRNTAVLAKQAATIDNLSGGRLMLGLALGAREDDYEVAGVDYRSRGRLFDRQLEELGRLWAGERGVGPPPARGARPALLVGGQSDATFRRVAQHADGWTMGGGTPDTFREGLGKLRAAWREAGREGEPRTMVLLYFALGEGAEQAARDDLGHYYAWLGDYAEQIVQSAATDEGTVKAYLSAFEDAGADEVMCFPASADPAQVDLLASAVR